MVGWDAKGTYRVQRGASLMAASSSGPSGNRTNSSPNEFFQFKYNFQPESVDKSRPGGLVGNGETFELEFAGSSGGSSTAASASASDQIHNGPVAVINGAGEPEA
ncbi:hypothetical protein BC939DRAFT_472880 [Gamsiella multidivaricata]|uniref:uncharacterized protein n=1 Tax=Gamsiella multidivaricata TaxID=101098 RepID=UPI00221FF74E|nr:uncharacterized protein BC939DRAFT_472880 [Gamsiella multidivaricata]KAI7831785.1 hypothetical protein BC939DRAFT_472880 [Gamsiella multidivaricata]